MLAYQINTSSDIILHGTRMRTRKVEGHEIQDWWKKVHTTAQYLQSARMPTSLGDIVKGSTLGIHLVWTTDISSGRTTGMQSQAMIHSLGTHNESKKFNEDITPKTEETGLLATDVLAAQVQSILLNLEALLATGTQRDKRYNYKGRV